MQQHNSKQVLIIFFCISVKARVTVIVTSTMKNLSTSTAIIVAVACSSLSGAAARSVISPLSGVNIFPSVNFKVEVNAAHANSIDGLGPLYGPHGNRAYGNAYLYRPLLKQIQAKLDTPDIDAPSFDAPSFDEDEVRQVQTLRLMGTTPWHTDCEMDGPNVRKLPTKMDKLQAQLQVGFFFSNTNENAYFETKDGRICIPVVENNFVSFNGREPHRSVVMSGHVDMVGPFLLSNNALSIVAMLLQATGPVTAVRRKRQLSTEDDSISTEGTLLMGDITDSETYPAGDNFVKLDASGLPPGCTNDCTMSIALANSRECTEDIHGSARKVLLQEDLFYMTNEEGHTVVPATKDSGWYEQVFSSVTESENSPISLAEVVSMLNADPAVTNTSAPVIYLYNKEKVPVACSFLETLTDEEREKFDLMFEDAAAAAAVGDTSGAGSFALLSSFAASAIMTSALFVLGM